MNNLFICTTQYQIFNACNLVRMIEGKSDLLILDDDSKLINNIDKGKAKSIFFNVFSYNICKICASNHYKVLFYLKELFSNKAYSMDYNYNYDNIFISGTELHSKIIAMKYLKKWGCLYYLEDGLESYAYILNSNSKYKQDTILKIFFGKRSLDVCNALYVYRPEFVMNNTNNIIIKKIEMEQNFKTNIFKDNVSNFKKKYVFLTAWFKEAKMYQEQEKYIDLLKKYKPNDYCVKAHPKDLKIKNGKYIVDNCGNFEIANMYYDMSDNVFISIISTACLTPYMLYNRKPILIFLYKIFLKKYMFKEWIEAEKVIMAIASSNEYMGKIYIPESLEELKIIIKSL